MAFIEQDMRAADGLHCSKCNEPMPMWSWLCPNCILAENPIDILDDMKRLIVEVEEPATISDEAFRAVESTFWTLHAVASASFSREESVVEGLMVLEDMLYAIVDEREQLRLVKMKRRLLISLAVALVVSAIVGIATIL